jgi:hypothetical protein
MLIINQKVLQKRLFNINFMQKIAKNRNKATNIKKNNVTLQKESRLKRNKYVSTVFI